jgi:murein L,D-transpeptidase YafK
MKYKLPVKRYGAKAVALNFMLCAMKIITAIILLLISATSFAEIADRIVVVKSRKMLYLQNGGKVFASYPVVFGSNPDGHKQKQGDGRTPEGVYTIDAKKANSAYYKALHVSYPNAKDIVLAKASGVSPGGDIMIHGQKNGFSWASFIVQYFNWTKGCIALTNGNMEHVWQSVNEGTTIEIQQ